MAHNYIENGGHSPPFSVHLQIILQSYLENTALQAHFAVDEVALAIEAIEFIAGDVLQCNQRNILCIGLLITLVHDTHLLFSYS